MKTPFALPLHVDRDHLIDAKGQLVCDLTEAARQEREYIVNAVNSYESMRKALHAAWKAFDGEEDSVKKEHADVIKQLSSACDLVSATMEKQ